MSCPVNQKLPWEPIVYQVKLKERVKAQTMDVPALFAIGLITLTVGTVVLGYIALTGYRPKERQ